MYWNAFTRPSAFDPWLEFHRIHSALASVEYPPVEVWSKDDGALLRAQLPGTTPEDVELEVEKDKVTLKGPRPGSEAGRFVREIQLPFAAESGGVRATLSRGLLEVELPRAEAEKPKKITVAVK